MKRIISITAAVFIIATVCMVAIIPTGAVQIGDSTIQGNQPQRFPIAFDRLELRGSIYESELEYMLINLPTHYIPNEESNSDTEIVSEYLLASEPSYVGVGFLDDDNVALLNGQLSLGNNLHGVREITFKASDCYLDESFSNNSLEFYIDTKGTFEIEEVGIYYQIVYCDTIENIVNNELVIETEWQNLYRSEQMQPDTRNSVSISLDLSETYENYEEYNEYGIVWLQNFAISITVSQPTTSGLDMYFEIEQPKGQWLDMPMEAYSAITTHDIYIESISLENISFVKWITTNMNDLFSTELIPNITIGGILWVIIGVSLLFVILKVFLGG